MNVALRRGKKVEAKEADFALSNHARAPDASAFLARFDMCNHRLIEHSKHSHRHNYLLHRLILPVSGTRTGLLLTDATSMLWFAGEFIYCSLK